MIFFWWNFLFETKKNEIKRLMETLSFVCALIGLVAFEKTDPRRFWMSTTSQAICLNSLIKTQSQTLKLLKNLELGEIHDFRFDFFIRIHKLISNLIQNSPFSIVNKKCSSNGLDSMDCSSVCSRWSEKSFHETSFAIFDADDGSCWTEIQSR